MKVASAVVVALVLGVVLVPGVVQGQILRWDNGQPIPGTEFVDPVRYAAGDLRGYGFSNLDLSYADLHGMDMSGTSWITNRGSKIDLRDTKWSDSKLLPYSLGMLDLRRAYFPSTGNPFWAYNSSGISYNGTIRWDGGGFGDRWRTGPVQITSARPSAWITATWTLTGTSTAVTSWC